MHASFPNVHFYKRRFLDSKGLIVAFSMAASILAFGCAPQKTIYATLQKCESEYPKANRSTRDLFRACREGVQIAAEQSVAGIDLQLVEISERNRAGEVSIRTVTGFSSEGLDAYYEQVSQLCFERYSERERTDACRFGAIKYASEVREYLIKNRFIRCVVLDIRREVGVPRDVLQGRARLTPRDPGEFCILQKDLSTSPHAPESR